MVADLDAIVAEMQTRLDAAGGLDGSVKIDLGDAGAIRIEGGSITRDDGPADCTLGMDMGVFEAIAAGDLGATAAFMQGKIRVDGDMGLAMKLAPLLA